jgi:hypothetical protein
MIRDEFSKVYDKRFIDAVLKKILNIIPDIGYCIYGGTKAFYLKQLLNFGNLKLQALEIFEKSYDFEID